MGCRSSDQSDIPPSVDTLPSREAAVVRIQPQVWPLTVRSQGVLVADEVALVGTRAAGSVAKVFVDLGDLVRAGEPLVELDQEEFRLQVEQAEAELVQARSALGMQPGQPIESLDPQNAPPVRQEHALRQEASANLERAKLLRAQEVISPADFDQILAVEQVANARHAATLNSVQEKIALIGVRQAELAVARERLRNAVVDAPFDGLVQQRHVAPGGYVQVGDQIVTLVRTDPLRFRGTVPERHAQHLAVGQDASLRIEGVAEPRSVRIKRISPVVEQSSRSLMFEAELKNDDQQLRTGLFAEAEIVVDPQHVAIVVPHSAIVEFAGAEKVWKVVAGVAGEQEVLAGQRRVGGIEILSGLSPGDVILSDGSRGSVARITPLPSPDLNHPAAPEKPSETQIAPVPESDTSSASSFSG